MGRTTKAMELLEQAKDNGMRIEFDSGFVVVKRTETGDPEKQLEIIAELGKHLREVRTRLERRATATFGKQFLGQQIWSADHGFGVLVDAGTDNGLLAITNQPEKSSPSMTVTAETASLLLILHEGADDASSPQNDKPAPEQPRKGILERLRGPRGED